MKVVLFCGGLGTRLREYSETVPKPMVEIGYRPIIWHLMKYYAHFGHTDFILCLGYRGDYIKRYFLQYDECMSNDFEMSEGGRVVKLHNSDISDWTLTFVDTGLNSNIGQRLKAVERYLQGEEVFMANYTDGLCNLDLNQYLDYFVQQSRVASFLSVRPSNSYHHVTATAEGIVKSVDPIDQGGFWINGGFFVFRPEIFNYIKDREELVFEPFQRLIAEEQLTTYQNPDFWACMDTFKEKKMFDDMYASGKTPWTVWDQAETTTHQGLQVQMERSVNGQVLLDRSNLVPLRHHGDQFRPRPNNA